MRYLPIGLMPNVHLGLLAFACLAALIGLGLRKGGVGHRGWGLMHVVLVVAALPLAIRSSYLSGDAVLAVLAVLNVHLALGAQRSLRLKKLHQGLRPGTSDMVLHGTTAVVYLGLVIWGGSGLLLGDRQAPSGTFLAFGFGGALISSLAIHRFFKTSHDRNAWLYGHVFGMLMSLALVLATMSTLLRLPIPLLVRAILPIALGLGVAWYVVDRLRKLFPHGRRVSDRFRVRIK